MENIENEICKNYTAQDARKDSDRALWPHKERQIRIAAWREFGYTIITIAFIICGTALFTLPTLGV